MYVVLPWIVFERLSLVRSDANTLVIAEGARRV
jgi:hypothetical protein